MNMKQKFIKPEILQELTLLGDRSILAGSVVNNATVVSMGQEVTDIDAGNQDWNQQWNWD